jgi:hypothetical protein
LPIAWSLAALAVFAFAAPARASFHFWRIKEIFSNADGTIQFIEFFTTSGGETLIANHSVQAISDNGTPVTYTFPNQNFGSSTANKHFLLATAGFDALPNSPTPDFTPLPNNFFNPNAASIQIDFAHGSDVTMPAINGSMLPKDGINSINDSVFAFFGDTDVYATAANSPTNFAGATGSINAAPSPAADFTGNGVVNAADLANWRQGFGTAAGATKMQGDANSDQDVDGADFLKWQEQTTNAGAASPLGAAVPEPATAALASLAVCWIRVARRAWRA